MTNRLYEARRKNSKINEIIVDNFAKKMPKLLDIILEGIDYDCHIGTKEIAMMAEPYITDKNGEHIGFHWTYDEVMSAVKGIVDFDETRFYKTDLFVWANVKYGDMQHLDIKDEVIIGYAISELTDYDFPYYPASQRAYCWLKKHIENEEKI